MTTADLGASIDILERTPSVFSALLAGLSDEWTERDEGPETFTARDNLAHLVHADRTNWIPRARVILEGAAPRRFAEWDRFGHRAASAGRPVEALLGDFAAVRRLNLETLRGWRLTEAQLRRTAEHPALGPVTLGQLVSTWAAHDLGHLAQTARVMAKRQRGAVGPWAEYLPIVWR